MTFNLWAMYGHAGYVDDLDIAREEAIRLAECTERPVEICLGKQTVEVIHANAHNRSKEMVAR